MFTLLHLCDGVLYCLVHDVLFSVDLFTVTQLVSVPNIVEEGFGRICVCGDKVLVTNDREFFEFDPLKK